MLKGIYLESFVVVKTKLALLAVPSEECLVAKEMGGYAMDNHNTWVKISKYLIYLHVCVSACVCACGMYVCLCVALEHE